MAKILVVDDVRFIQQMVASIFGDQGHEVITADDGATALEKAQSERPDLILLDIAMPGMDGVEVARELRANPATSRTPILMVTSQSDTKSIARATEAGADDHCPKPFDTPTLLKKAGKLLGSYRMSFSLEDVDDVPVVTVLRGDVEDLTVRELEEALAEACSRGRRVVLDLSRVTKVDGVATDSLTRHADELRREGRPLVAVRPGKGIGTRTLVVRLGPHADVVDNLQDALKAAGASEVAAEAASLGLGTEPAPAPAVAPEAPILPPESAAAAAPSAGATCLVETLGNVAMARVKAASFAEALPVIREVVVPLTQRNILLNVKGLHQITDEELAELSRIAEELQAKGRAPRIVKAEPPVAAALEAAGLAHLLAESKGKATRASS